MKRPTDTAVGRNARQTAVNAGKAEHARSARSGENVLQIARIQTSEVATVDDEFGAGDVDGVVGGEECDGGRVLRG
jgi:hypothetical protein